MPTESFVRQPFAAWKVKSNGPSQGKYIAVNKDRSVQAFDSTPSRLGSTFVIIEERPVQCEQDDENDNK